MPPTVSNMFMADRRMVAMRAYDALHLPHAPERPLVDQRQAKLLSQPCTVSNAVSPQKRCALAHSNILFGASSSPTSAAFACVL